jgi:hypothetical protein
MDKFTMAKRSSLSRRSCKKVFSSLTAQVGQKIKQKFQVQYLLEIQEEK